MWGLGVIEFSQSLQGLEICLINCKIVYIPDITVFLQTPITRAVASPTISLDMLAHQTQSRLRWPQHPSGQYCRAI